MHVVAAVDKPKLPAILERLGGGARPSSYQEG